MRKTLVIFCSISICVVIIWIVKVTLDRQADLDSTDIHYTIPKQIQYSYTLQNTSNKRIKKAEFWTYAPLKQTATQSCVRIKSSHAYQLISDDLGNQILHFSFDNFPPYATKLISVKADLLLSKETHPVSENNLSPYLKPEKHIESDDVDLTRMAQRLKAKSRSNTAEKIFRWVGDNLQYAGYVSNERGAKYALTHKKGDCTEFMALFVALSRANEIPSRGIGGYVCRESTVLKPAGYHNWAEFYDQGTWKIADPQNKVFTKNTDDYIAMRIISESSNIRIPQFNRFSFSGEGLRVHMN